MNTKLLMRVSAIYLALLGAVASFLPQEVLTYSGVQSDQGAVAVLLIQVAGALYLGFAGLNWTAQANLIGGIYSKPVALANFTHFTVASIALLKGIAAGQREVQVLVGCAAYVLFAVAFAFVLFVNPSGLHGKRSG